MQSPEDHFGIVQPALMAMCQNDTMPRFLIAIDDEYMTHFFPQYDAEHDRIIEEEGGVQIRQLEMIVGTSLPFSDSPETPLERVVYEIGMISALGFRPNINAGFPQHLYGGWPTEVGVIAFTEESYAAMRRATNVVKEVAAPPFPYKVLRFDADPLDFRLYHRPDFNTFQDHNQGISVATPHEPQKFLSVSALFLPKFLRI